ncbi:MAG: hypothetical protein NC102_09315 [Clostridium sp.]|nr:hypothetical protein [Clostridium sp.]
MRSIKTIYLFLPTILAWSCSDSGQGQEPDTAGGNIKLSASAGKLAEASSRAAADPFLGTTPSEDYLLDTELWFSTEKDKYPHNPQGEEQLPVHAGLTFDGPQTQYIFYNNQNIKYPTGNNPVYCLGLYPNDGGWAYDEAQAKVTHEIDGNTDLMFARPIEGSWTSQFQTIRYEHALTWVKIAVCAVSFNSLDAWGKLKQISIWSSKSVDIGVKMDVDKITTPDPNEVLEDRYAYSQEGQWIKTLNFAEPVDITSTMEELGSVFCSPDTEYRLYIETENNSLETTVQLNWLDDDDGVSDVRIPARARGKCFVISLYFHPYKVVTAACTLDKWNAETDDIYMD